jgi:hypothetical protein
MDFWHLMNSWLVLVVYTHWASFFWFFFKSSIDWLSLIRFKIAFALTSRGDLKKKLEYAFALYDADNSGYLDRNEVREVITGMLDLLGADKRSHNPQQLAEECIKELDSSNDGKISKQVWLFFFLILTLSTLCIFYSNLSFYYLYIFETGVHWRFAQELFS